MNAKMDFIRRLAEECTKFLTPTIVAYLDPVQKRRAAEIYEQASDRKR